MKSLESFFKDTGIVLDLYYDEVCYNNCS